MGLLKKVSEARDTAEPATPSAALNDTVSRRPSVKPVAITNAAIVALEAGSAGASVHTAPPSVAASGKAPASAEPSDLS